MRNLPIRRYLWLLVAILLSIMLAITAFSLIVLRAEDSDINGLTTVVEPAYELNAAILQTMTNAETGLRGYLIDFDPVLLAPYNDAQRQVHAKQAQLAALLKDRGNNYQRLEAAQDAATARWWRYAEHAKNVATQGTVTNPLTGKGLFDQVRAANAALAGKLTTHLTTLRAQSRHTLGTFAVTLLVAAVLAVLAGLAAAAAVSRAVRENTELVTGQAEALRLQQAASGIGRAIRATAGVQEAADVACASLGSALAARRVAVTTFDDSRNIAVGAQWHAPGLAAITRVSADLRADMSRVADELWRGGGSGLVVDDLATDRLVSWAQRAHQETGATALILAPIGLGDRALGNLYVITDTGRRRWTDAEAAFVQQIATFLARAITQGEFEVQRGEYIGRLEDLDRQKTEFLSTVSHELRTPLTSIQGYLELLLEGDAGPLADGQHRMLGVIERNTSRLRGLIEDILVLNKIETGGLLAGNTDVPVSELVDHTAEELRPLADKKPVQFRVTTDHDPAAVTGDRTQLQRALVNIVSNAIKFTPAQGTVRLSCDVDPVAEEVVVTCTDTGIGIPQGDQAHLFTRFFRASNAARQAIPGTGLGLAIVAAIVDIHHGRLALDSTEGEGTTITLRFPKARTDPTTPDDAET